MGPTRLFLTRDDLRSVSNIAEALCNLTYLISEEAEHPNRVRQYASLSEDLLRALTELLKEKRHYADALPGPDGAAFLQIATQNSNVLSSS